MPYRFLLVCAVLVAACTGAAAQESPLPPGPAAFQPESRAVINTSSVALQWYFFEGANLFRVQAAFTSTFDAVFLDDTTPHHYYILADLPLDGTRIYWRIRACTLTVREDDSSREDITCLSLWSPPYSFYSGKPNGNEEDEDSTGKPDIIAYITDCIGLKASGNGAIPWADYWLFFLVMALAAQYRTPGGKN